MTIARDKARVYRGRIFGAPENDENGWPRVRVKVPELLGERHTVGPCRFTPGTAPSDGDEALVVFDQHGEPWVAAWFPTTPVED